VRIANETLLVFAPLAKLLGIYKVKNELEELAFKWSTPEVGLYKLNDPCLKDTCFNP
jgi:(p)ppGpp synthase/HD superfamily hydrolase